MAEAKHIMKEAYGDWQTNLQLALAVCCRLKEKGLRPQVVIEPTCGQGNFIVAALMTFDSIEEIYGIEIYKPYLDILLARLSELGDVAKKVKVHLVHQDIFEFDMALMEKSLHGKEILAIGNPPWVTNSRLGAIEIGNFPPKSNFKKARGIDAITGKGNFDIAEYICCQMIEFLSNENAHVAFLLKNSVVKNIVAAQKTGRYKIDGMEQHHIDAQKEFSASVSASLFYSRISSSASKICQCYDFYSRERKNEFGWVDGKFVANIEGYANSKDIDGVSPFEWRSGVKHDCSSIMELTKKDGHYVNGLGEVVEIEEDVIYPLLKSSDIKSNELLQPRKYVILTQHHTNEDTRLLKERFPLLYKYLLAHASLLDGRKSVIYKNRPRFCMFGVGDYSFKKYKVVVSGLYKHARFILASDIKGKNVIPDDTCYFIGFDNYLEAKATLDILNGTPVQNFIQSVFFYDAKRSINKEILMRIDVGAAMTKTLNEHLVCTENESKFYADFLYKRQKPVQLSLFQ